MFSSIFTAVRVWYKRPPRHSEQYECLGEWDYTTVWGDRYSYHEGETGIPQSAMEKCLCHSPRQKWQVMTLQNLLYFSKYTLVQWIIVVVCIRTLRNNFVILESLER